MEIVPNNDNDNKLRKADPQIKRMMFLLLLAKF